MSPEAQAAVLRMVADLYRQIESLQLENAELRAALAERASAQPTEPAG